MLHYNQKLESKSPGGAIVALATPEIYLASSIADLKEGRKDIKPTSLIQEFLFNLRNYRHTFLSLNYQDLAGAALVVIPSVRYLDCFLWTAGLEDLTGRLVTGVEDPENLRRQNEEEKVEPGQTATAIILYDKENDFPYLLGLTKAISSESLSPSPAHTLSPRHR